MKATGEGAPEGKGPIAWFRSLSSPARLAVIIAVGLGVAFLAERPDRPSTPESTLPPLAEVTYEVTGSAETVDITIETPTGTSQQSSVTVPLRTTAGQPMTFLFQRGAFVYLSAQNTGEFGTVTCTIRAGARVISTATSSGAYTIASCDGTA